MPLAENSPSKQPRFRFSLQKSSGRCWCTVAVSRLLQTAGHLADSGIVVATGTIAMCTTSSTQPWVSSAIASPEPAVVDMSAPAQHRAAALCPHDSGMRCHHCSKRVVAFRRACACLRIWVGAHVYVCAYLPVRECDQARGRALCARACAWLRVWVGVHGYLCARTCACEYLRECGRVYVRVLRVHACVRACVHVCVLCVCMCECTRRL